MSPSEREWLARVNGECLRTIVRLQTCGPHPALFDYLRKLFDERVDVTETTFEVKNLIASLAMTDPEVLKGRIALINAAIERLARTREYIKLELSHDPTH